MPGDVVVYDGLDRKAEKIAREAVAHIAGIQQRLVTDIVEIGNTLIRVKDAVGHGRFLPWLKAEFNWTERTAQSYMSVAERIGPKAKHVSHLPLRTVYQLAAPTVPDEVRNEIVGKLESGEAVELDEIDAELSEVRQAAKREREQERRLAKKSPEARARAIARFEREKAEAARTRAKLQEERERRDADRAAAANLIVKRLAPNDLAQLLNLLSGQSYVGADDLIAAQERAKR